MTKKSIVLNREQIDKLSRIVEHFKEVEHFTIETDNSSGIGVSVVVKLVLFENSDTKIDITDLKEW